MYWLRKYFTDWRAHVRAFAEVFIAALFSLMLFFVPYLVKIARGTSMHSGETLVERGQFFLLAYGVYGTIFWLAFVRWDRVRHGARTLFGVLATFAVIPVIAFLGVDPSFKSVINEEAIRISYWLYFGFLFVNYLLLFYMDVSPPDPEAVLREGADALAERYREMKEKAGG